MNFIYIIHTTLFKYLESILQKGLMTSYSDRKDENYIWFNLGYIVNNEINGTNLGCYDDIVTLIFDINKIIVDILYDYYNDHDPDFEFQIAYRNTTFRHDTGARILWSTRGFFYKK
jgi:hypothetical protein